MSQSNTRIFVDAFVQKFKKVTRINKSEETCMQQKNPKTSATLFISILILYS